MPPSSHSRQQVTLTQVLALLLAFVVVGAGGGLLLAALTMPAVAAARTATDLGAELLDDLPAGLERRPLAQRSVMLAADGTVIAEFFAENRVVVPLDQMSWYVQQAVIATEDRRFEHHAGIDPEGMARALVQNQLTDSRQGASTLTQQYVKNVLVERAAREGDHAAVEAARETEGAQGYARKLREARLALALEREMTKDEILEGYLNIAPFGVAVYGVESAARRYFSKPAADLDLLEAATIAGITQSPSALDPTRSPQAAENRRNTVLMLMRDQGVITPEQHDAGVATPIGDTLRVSPARSGCMTAQESVPGSGFFCDYVTRVIRNDPAFGETPEERADLLYRGGLVITTTLDPRLQTLADTEVKAGVPVDDASGIGAAMVVVQPGTGNIVAMAQNRVFDNSATATGRAVSVNYSASYSYGGSGGFAPGSTLKPFTLLEWLRQGNNLGQRVDGTARTLDTNQFTACGQRLPREAWPVRNAEGTASGSMTVMDATRQSVNLAYLSMAMQLDLCDIVQGAADLGVTQSPQSTEGERFGAYPANVLGSQSTTPLALAGAYAAFAADGVFCSPVAITEVRDPSGRSLPVPGAGCEETVDPEVAAAMNYALGQVWQGTGRRLGSRPYAAAGKTGTTSRNEQTWFVGYTPRLAAASWVGHPDSFTPMQNVVIDGRRIPFVFGATVAGESWKRFMDQALADGEPNPAFTTASGETRYGRSVVPSVVGMTQDEAVALLRSHGFEAVIGGSTTSTLPVGTIASQSRIGSAVAGSTITLFPSRGTGDGAAGTGGSATGTAGTAGDGTVGGIPPVEDDPEPVEPEVGASVTS